MNIIPYRNDQNFDNLFPFLLDSKIIIQSHSFRFFQTIVNKYKFIIIYLIIFFLIKIIVIHPEKHMKYSKNSFIIIINVFVLTFTINSASLKNNKIF